MRKRLFKLGSDKNKTFESFSMHNILSTEVEICDQINDSFYGFEIYIYVVVIRAAIEVFDSE